MDTKKEILKLMQYRIETGVKEIINNLGLDLLDPNFKDTPARVAKSYFEILEGIFPAAQHEINHHLSKTFPCNNDEMVVIKNVLAWSMCPHHFLPVKYRIDMAYLPSEDVIGLSKLPRLAILLAKRPVLQEQLTQDIASYLQQILKPRGVAVYVEGIHMCMQMRGIRATGSSVTTSHVTGVFKDSLSTKSEFLAAIADRSLLTF